MGSVQVVEERSVKLTKENKKFISIWLNNNCPHWKCPFWCTEYDGKECHSICAELFPELKIARKTHWWCPCDLFVKEYVIEVAKEAIKRKRSPS